MANHPKIFPSNVRSFSRITAAALAIWLSSQARAAVGFEFPMQLEGSATQPSGIGALKGLPSGGIAVNGGISSYILTNDLSVVDSFLTGFFRFPFTVQSDGRFIVRGAGNSVLRRLNLDGTLDPTFSGPTGDPTLVRDIVIQPDGKILVGSANALSRGLFRLNADGSGDTSFSFPAGAIEPIETKKILLRPDGKIIAIFFNQVRQFLTNGETDQSFSIPIVGNSIESMALQKDGKIVIFGGFSDVNRIPRNGLARLDAFGNLDFDFNPTPQLSPGGNAFTVHIQSDGRIVTGDGRIVSRYFPNGALDPSFVRKMTGNTLQGSTLDSSGRIFVAESGTIFKYSGRLRVQAPEAPVDAFLQTSSLVESRWTTIQNIPANTRLDFIDDNYPGTQNTFYRAIPAQ